MLWTSWRICVLGFFQGKVSTFIQISLKNCEFESLVECALPTFINHNMSLIWEVKLNSPFFPYPPPFSFPDKVVLGAIVEVGKSENQILDPPLPPYFSSHGQDIIRENFQCLNKSMEPKVEVDPLTFQDHINAHNPNHESVSIESIISSMDIHHPLSLTPHGFWYPNSLDQFSSRESS